ncbi:hypothetical protein [Spirosoma foliorum]|uniref:IrrE N-terminal-like domain-containing protein n=1 Tax=Spirosoma foliorum TaxID=2710596 RepID=A0A7G5H2S6_9BACT|nr:hypothetical protein [Spirosoma foliorum]QMW05418.1 hypothetical protein H3H32_11250 [Spirosoma foliorum]
MNNNPLKNSHEPDSDAFEQMFHQSLQQHGFIFPENAEDIEALRQQVLTSNIPVPDDLPSSASILNQGRIETIKGWNFVSQPEDEAAISWQRLLAMLKQVGFSEVFVKRRLLPTWATDIINRFDSNDESYQLAIKQTLAKVAKIFSISAEDIVELQSLPLPAYQHYNTRYKKPINTEVTDIAAYTLYAKTLAEILLKASANLPVKSIPTDYHEFRSQVEVTFGPLTFENTLRYVWSLGIPVLPLTDTVNFHGACFRISGRNVIVLKQNTTSIIRWLFDLLHEVKHASDYLDETVREVVETSALFSSEMNLSDEEKAANQFANDVVLDGRGGELAFKVVKAAGGREQALKAKVIEIASQENVPPGALANYLAYLLKLQQNRNWWSTAVSLQPTNPDPRLTAKTILNEYIRFDILSIEEKEILENALS